MQTASIRPSPQQPPLHFTKRCCLQLVEAILRCYTSHIYMIATSKLNTLSTLRCTLGLKGTFPFHSANSVCCMQVKVVPMAAGEGLEGESSPSPSSPGGQQPAIHCLPPHQPPPPASNLAWPAIQRVVVVRKGPAQSTASLRRNMMQYGFRKWANLFGTHQFNMCATKGLSLNICVATQ